MGIGEGVGTDVICELQQLSTNNAGKIKKSMADLNRISSS
jgi:hypothetical protein